MTEGQLRRLMVTEGRRLASRGLAHGSTGNLSCRTPDGGFLLTPTGSRLGDLSTASLSRLNADGHHIDGCSPTREVNLHLAAYAARPGCRAIAHSHGGHCVAWTVRKSNTADEPMPLISAYQYMRCGLTAAIPYFAPGDTELAIAVGKMAGDHHTLLLAAHGPVACGGSLPEACESLEELEETARILILLKGERLRTLTPIHLAELDRKRAGFS